VTFKLGFYTHELYIIAFVYTVPELLCISTISLMGLISKPIETGNLSYLKLLAIIKQ